MSEAAAPSSSAEAKPCEVWFYHLERTAPEAVLAELLEKTLARGWRAKITAPDRARLETLDAKLWTDRPDAFLPHGLEDEPNAERQPILLGVGGRTLTTPMRSSFWTGPKLGLSTATPAAWTSSTGATPIRSRPHAVGGRRPRPRACR